MADYTIRMTQSASGGWHWYADDESAILTEGYSFTLWDALSEAYRAMRDDLNKDGGLQW